MTDKIKIVKFMEVIKVNRNSEWLEDAGDMPDLFKLLKGPQAAIVKYQGEKPTGAVQPGTTGRVETAESVEKTIGIRDIPTELRHEQAGRKIKDDEICVKIICAGIE